MQFPRRQFLGSMLGLLAIPFTRRSRPKPQLPAQEVDRKPVVKPSCQPFVAGQKILPGDIVYVAPDGNVYPAFPRSATCPTGITDRIVITY